MSRFQSGTISIRVIRRFASRDQSSGLRRAADSENSAAVASISTRNSAGQLANALRGLSPPSLRWRPERAEPLFVQLADPVDEYANPRR